MARTITSITFQTADKWEITFNPVMGGFTRSIRFRGFEVLPLDLEGKISRHASHDHALVFIEDHEKHTRETCPWFFHEIRVSPVSNGTVQIHRLWKDLQGRTYSVSHEIFWSYLGEELQNASVSGLMVEITARESDALAHLAV